MANLAPTNLADYYSSKGQALPSLSDRASLYEAHGLGKATDYQGTADQNTQLLSKLSPAPEATGPKTQDIPGVGTLTVYPKKPTVSADQSAPASGGDNMAGVYARTGVQPAPDLTVDTSKIPAGWDAKTYANFKAANPNLEPTAEDTAKMLGLPSYGPTASGQPGQSLIDIYQGYAGHLKDIADNLAKIQNPTQEEKDLATKLNEAKSTLDKFDTETLQRAEAYRGQGRGQTNSFVALNINQDARTRALQRLGLAQDVTNYTNLLSTAQKNRGDMTDAEKMQYDLTSKQLDSALGIQKEMDSLSEKEQANARQYLLDVTNFAKGKTFEELDPATQAAITAATANTPITIGMVKSALANSSSKVTYQTENIGGRYVRIGFDDSGKEVSRTDLGDAGAPGNGGTSDVFGQADGVIKQYFDNNISRADIEKQYKDAGKAIPPEVQKALDKYYPVPASSSAGSSALNKLGQFWAWLSRPRSGTTSAAASGNE